MNAKSFPSSVTPMPIVTIQTALTSVHARLDTLGTEKLVQVRTCIEYYSTILQRSRGNTQNHIYTFQAEQRRRSVFKQSGGGGGGVGSSCTKSSKLLCNVDSVQCVRNRLMTMQEEAVV